MAQLRIKRGTRAQLDAAAAASGLRLGEPYLITDESRIAVGLSATTYEVYAKSSEAGGGGGGDVTGPAASTNDGLVAFSGTTGKIIQNTGVLLPGGPLVDTISGQTLSGKTLSGVVLNDGYTEEIFVVTGTGPTLSPGNGSIQTWTLTGNSNPVPGLWLNGQSMTMMIDDGTAFTINWASLAIQWKTEFGAAPTLNAGALTGIVLWKASNALYGARVGNN